MKIRVYYEDTDTGGIVYHSNYLNFCERARSQAFFDKGMVPVLDDGHFVARRIVADYFKSAKLGDILEIKTQLVEMKAASFTLKQGIYKEDEKLFELEILLVHTSFEGAVKKIDQKTKELILTLF
ncbi:YbgC/FadM family acyl-CoA thioesterase [Sulfurimonas sp.]|uniref:YbgC/FadM family acyl-CoA thioesterase n=1 Tax=Sulfurimonas sp. TaxID=2022749 RepID=UPI003D0B91B0